MLKGFREFALRGNFIDLAVAVVVGAAIAAHPNKVRQISLGFDLWWEVMASGHVKTATFTKGGVPVDEKDPNIALKVPLAVVGKDMVVSIDVSLAPDDYRLGP